SEKVVKARPLFEGGAGKASGSSVQYSGATIGRLYGSSSTDRYSTFLIGLDRVQLGLTAWIGEATYCSVGRDLNVKKVNVSALARYNK
ncbi:hypothetical protein THAOC_01459, partial [Thalassiosira oceanica]